MKTQFFPLVVALIMAACQNKSNETNINEEQLDMIASEPSLNAPMQEMVKFAPPAIKDDAEETGTTPNSSEEKSTTKKIIKDGSISIKVQDIGKAKTKMDVLVKEAGAYYENEEFENYESRTLYTLKVRVPSAKFEILLGSAEKADGEVTSKTINTRDVTEEYVDTEIRLESKRLFRKRYTELLAKAGKVVDVLAIEENIRNLQEEIESKEGRLRYLDDQVTYSTLDITLFHNKEMISEKEVPLTFFQRTKNSFSNGWNNLVELCLWCMKQWPWIICFLLSFFSLKSYLRKKKRT